MNAMDAIYFTRECLTLAGLGRVLLTGSWERMIDNLAETLSGSYKLTRCALSENDFNRACRTGRPHAVVLCLSGETNEVAKLKDTLAETLQSTGAPVLVIGHEEDCENFKQNITLPYTDLFPRPLDTAVFRETLTERVAQAQQDEQQRLQAGAENPPVVTAPPPPPEPVPAPQNAATVRSTIDIPVDYAIFEEEVLTPAEKEMEVKLVQQIEMMTLLYGRQRVLVVDDDVRMLNVIKLYLQDLYDITVVPTGKLAIKFLSQKKADMVLLDYMMPEMDGPAVLKQIREELDCSDIPVLFLTGVADKEMVLKGLEHGPNGYLLKPITRMALLERVTEILLDLH